MGGFFGEHQKQIPIAQNIKTYVNLDMICRSTPKNKETIAHVIAGFENTIAGVKKFVDEINDKTMKWPLSYSLGGMSDHASFNKKDIPSISFWGGHHDDVHMPTDDAEKIDYEKMEKISQLVYWITKELAEREEIPNFTE